jgi:hypothetical protein
MADDKAYKLLEALRDLRDNAMLDENWFAYGAINTAADAIEERLDAVHHYSDPKGEIEPDLEHFSDPYVLQLIETLSRQQDEIEHMQEVIDRVALIRLDLDAENIRLRDVLNQYGAEVIGGSDENKRSTDDE